MSVSDAKEFYASKSFASWKKANEHEMKLQLAIINRLDGVMKAIQESAKSRR